VDSSSLQSVNDGAGIDSRACTLQSDRAAPGSASCFPCVTRICFHGVSTVTCRWPLRRHRALDIHLPVGGSPRRTISIQQQCLPDCCVPETTTVAQIRSDRTFWTPLKASCGRRLQSLAQAARSFTSRSSPPPPALAACPGRATRPPRKPIQSFAPRPKEPRPLAVRPRERALIPQFSSSAPHRDGIGSASPDPSRSDACEPHRPIIPRAGSEHPRGRAGTDGLGHPRPALAGDAAVTGLGI
jgi:hypothetical protein